MNPTDRVADTLDPSVDRRRFLGRLVAAGAVPAAGCLDTGPGELTVAAPEEALVDEQVPISVEGLAADQQVTVTATTTDADDEPWSSAATYSATDEGAVDVAEQPPTAGDYDGVHPMGLVWSMEPASEDADEWFDAEPTSAFDLEFVAETGDRSAETTVTLRNASPGVTRHEVESEDVTGEWWEREGDGPYPPILLLHGSGANRLSSRAATLASHGYAALTVQYFGVPGLPEYLVEVPVEYVTGAIDWFLDRDAVEGEDVGVLGSSKGAELALLLASHDDRVAAVVADSASGYVFEGVGRRWELGSSWQIDGDPVPYVPYPEGARNYVEYQDAARVLRPVYAAAVDEADDARLADAAIPVEDADASVLLLSGADDQMWPAARLSSVVVDRLDDAEYDHPYDHLVYENAGHSVGVPHLPDTWAPTGSTFAMGGTQNGRGKADADAWPRALATFDDALR